MSRYEQLVTRTTTKYRRSKYEGKYWYCYFCKKNVEPNVIPGNGLIRSRMSLCPICGGNVIPGIKPDYKISINSTGYTIGSKIKK
jgi:hypothetical protein